MIGNQPKFKYAFLGLDFIILTTAFLLSVTTMLPDFWNFAEHGFYFYYSYATLSAMLSFIYLFCFLSNNLYKRNIVLTRLRQSALVVKSLILGAIAAVLLLTLTNLNYFVLHGQKLLLLFTIYNILLFIVIRVLVVKKIFNILVRKNIYRRNVLIVGGDEAGRYVAKSLQNDPFSDFHIAGFLDDYKEVGLRLYEEYDNLGKLEDVDEVIKTIKVDEILIALDGTPYDRLIFIIDKCLSTGKVVRIYSDFLNVIAEKLSVERYADIPVVMFSQYPLEGMAWNMKRVFDTVAAFITLVLLLPLFCAVAIGIKLSDPGPVFYKQVRIGKGGKPFDFYKFRSMYLHNDDSEHREYVKKLIKEGAPKIENGIKVFKITNDPRIFRFGAFIRKASIDEFPQFFNVLKGDMSLVGPRPCMPFEWDLYDKWHKKRLNILPGCTGLWQALGRATVSFEEMVILDLFYISNVSPWLDFKIIWKTIPVLLFGKGGF